MKISTRTLRVFEIETRINAHREHSTGGLGAVHTGDNGARGRITGSLNVSLSTCEACRRKAEQLASRLLVRLSACFSISISSVLNSGCSTSVSSPSFLRSSTVHSMIGTTVSRVGGRRELRFEGLLRDCVTLDFTNEGRLMSGTSAVGQSNGCGEFNGVTGDGTSADSHNETGATWAVRQGLCRGNSLS